VTAVVKNPSRIPANAPKPQDRKPKKTPAQKAAAKALQAEAKDGYVSIESLGLTLQIPIGEDVPFDAYIAFEQGDEARGTRLLLGEEQWTAFLEKKPLVRDFNDIARQLLELTGN